jgi:hypothetical protein
MGKKSSGKTYTSKGERRSSAKTPTKNSADKMLNKQAAWLKGGNPWITIENPNKNETDKPFIRVRYNDLQHGSYRELQKKAFVMK